jgi:ppGpp synthetase/RelA/SpoT-type nucleotidyltranferase
LVAAVPDLADVSQITDAYAARIDLLEHVADRLQQDLIEHFRGRPHIDRISVRVKTLDSFVEKATIREMPVPYEVPLAEIEDQVAGRVLVHFLNDLKGTVDHVAKLLNPVEQDHKRPTRYNEFDYESLHGVYALPPQYLPSGWDEQEDMPETFELQVRTLFQHAYAEPQHNLGYKPGAPLTDEVRRELAWIAASSWGADHALERARGQLLDTG